MAMPFTSVLPKEWVEKVGKDIKRKPLGTGPFVIDSWTPGQEIVATRNPNYWEAGKPYLDSDHVRPDGQPQHRPAASRER